MKNAGGEPQRSTWGHLIKEYNTQAQGNVEHFSICSDDSIWEEQQNVAATVDHCYSTVAPGETNEKVTNDNNKFKAHIMEKYLKDLNAEVSTETEYPDDAAEIIDDRPKILSKWLQSAVNFRPRRENYVEWERKKSRSRAAKKKRESQIIQHAREELDAAEALTCLAYANASAS